ncbi:AbiJ-related protein [Arthrobacter ramosus]|uniref:mitogen-activated protein kinase kinase n=2 Tax=Arthrobacter ramosus TaxID=1672 RepID=A0ABV5Y3H5_ARTRM
MASIEYIPARLRSAFREQARGIVMHDIERMWQDEGFAPGSGQSFSGVRMSLWSDYEASVRWSDWEHVSRVLRVYEGAIAMATPDDRERLAGLLIREGFRVGKAGRIEYVGAGNRITEVTRTRILEYLEKTSGGRNWAGRFDPPEFLRRLYDLAAMPSEDPRFENAELDVWQHCVNNDDWDFDWVFNDSRFELSSDGMLLRFLAEMLHPAVRTNPEEVAALVGGLNEALRPDGYELYEKSTVSGRPLYAWRNLQSTIARLEKSGRDYALKSIGEGSYAHVYKYKDDEYGMHVAVKRARRTLNATELARFRAEFDVLASLSSPYVLTVYRYNESDNSYAMEYCDYALGKYIEENNNKDNFGFAKRKRIALQFLYGISYLAVKEVLHRDLSFTNVLVKTYDAGVVQVKLSDFGLHKTQKSLLTRTGTEMKGTILDPTLDSFKDYSLANEIYAVGHVLSFIFTGRKAPHVRGENLGRVVRRCTDLNLEARYKILNEIINEVMGLTEV